MPGASLPAVSGDQAIRAFERLGYERTRQKGLHVRLVASEADRKPLSIPRHKELKRGLLRGLIRDAGIMVKEFRDALQQLREEQLKMGHIVTKEEAEKDRSRDLCGKKFEQGDEVSGGRGKIVSARYSSCFWVASSAAAPEAGTTPI